MKVLLISYYFDTFPGVGAKRTSYWAEHLNEFDVDVEVITETEQVQEKKGIVFLPKTNRFNVLSKLIKDPGLTWKDDLLDYFESKVDFKFDWVIFSGGPFMHFGLGTYLQKKYGCKVLLDYRDPFGYNPRHKDGFLKRTIKTFYEKRYNQMADAIITVNEICKQDMSHSNKVTIISNGFDDQKLLSGMDKRANIPVTKGMILNGGKLYSDFRLDPLLTVLNEDDSLVFRQIGATYPAIDALKNDRICSHGFVAYNELLSAIEAAEICTVLTGGEAFETPTKTYDYIGLNKKILVVTEGEINTGGLQSILSDYPNVQWSINEKGAIRQAIQKLQQQELIKINPHPFSRKASLEKLVALLKSLN